MLKHAHLRALPHLNTHRRRRIRSHTFAPGKRTQAHR
uniref:Uncharacterized protein n=1 Tax=Anguilla anguilla TaxID=7936 RepID=A0A0E9TT65_ANGAN